MVKKRTFRIERLDFERLYLFLLYRRNKLYTPLEKKEKKYYIREKNILTH
jgi:hypothetical protein